MTTPAILTYDHIRQAIRHWPASTRLSLAQDILKDVALELPVTEAPDEENQKSASGKDTLSQALGLLASSPAEALSDATVKSWLDERRRDKYTK